MSTGSLKKGPEADKDLELAQRTPALSTKYARLKALEERLDASQRVAISTVVKDGLENIFAQVPSAERECGLGNALKDFAHSIPVSEECRSGLESRFSMIQSSAQNCREELIDDFVNDPALSIADKMFLTARFIRTPRISYNLDVLFFILQHGADKKNFIAAICR